MGSQRVGHDWATELNWTELNWTELNVHVERCSTRFAIRETNVQMTMDHTTYLLERLRRKQLIILNWWGQGETGTLTHCWWNCKWYSHYGWQLDSSLESWPFKEIPTTCPQISFLGIYLGEIEVYVHTKTSIQTYIVALLVIPPNWKHSNCPSTGNG